MPCEEVYKISAHGDESRLGSEDFTGSNTLVLCPKLNSTSRTKSHLNDFLLCSVKFQDVSYMGAWELTRGCQKCPHI